MVLLLLEEQPPLVQAVFAGDLELVRNLLQNKEDVNYQDNKKRSSLHAAAFKGDAAITKLLLEHGARVNTKDCQWLTPLHRACRTGSEETVSVLVDNAANTSARNRLWQTPLHIAATYNAIDCLAYLLERIPNPNVTDRSGGTALHHAVLNGHNEVVQLLISKGCVVNACDKKDCRPIHWAAHMGHTDTIELLLRSGADINARDRNQYTPLHVAAASGMVGACRILISYGAHIEAQNAYGNTPLHIACLNGHLPICEELVVNNADKEALNYRGQSPLHIAAASTHGVHCLNFLVGHNVNINRQSIDGRTPLHMTAIHGRFTRSKTLIDKGATVDCLDKNRCTALHIAAQHGHELLSNTLLSYGADVSRQGYEGRTPLHMCCLSGYVECCRAFIKAGIDINCQDDSGKTPTHCAAFKGSVECLDLLVSSGADFKMIDMIGRTPLHYSAAQGYFFCVFTLVGIGSSVNQVDNEGCTPLHLASAYDLEGRCIDYLIQHKANPKMKDCNGFTPIHYAVAGSNVIGLTYLLEAVGSSYLLCGPDMPATTPLHIAAKNGNEEILEKLIPYFPDPNIRNEYGCTPLLLAAREGHANCVQFLLRFGAKVSICDTTNRLSPVHHSAKNGRVHCLALLVDNAEDKKIIDMPDDMQRTALMLAVSGSHDDCVTTLIKSGANPNILDGDKHSCLFRAVVTGQHNILELLLPMSSTVNTPDVNGKTVLHVAAACGRLACIQRILPYMNREVSVGYDNQKFTALHWACYGGSSDCVAHFLKEGVFKKLDGNLFSAVHCATSAGSEKCLELLCSHYGPEIVQMCDSRMRTPLHIAALHGHTECAKYLLEQGAQIDCKDEDGRTPLVAAAHNGQVQIIEILISYKTDVTLYDNNGNTALHLACLHKHNLAALLLLEYIDDPDIINMINNDRRTPLHLSARNGLVDVTRQLITKGSSVTAVDANGLTPALSCAPNPSVAQCLAIILASHSTQGILQGNNTKELVQFPAIDTLDKFRSCKTNFTQTEMSLIKNPDQFEIEQMFGIKLSREIKEEFVRPYVLDQKFKKKKIPSNTNLKDDTCFIIENYETDDSSEKFISLGRDLHKSQSDMTLTSKTIYSEEDYGRIIQNSRPKDDVEKKKKVPVRKELEKGKVRLRANLKSEDDKKFLRRPGAKLDEEVTFRKVDGVPEHVNDCCCTDGDFVDRKRVAKLDEAKLKMPKPSVKKSKMKKPDDDDCYMCKLIAQRVVESDFKPERIKHQILDEAKEELIARKNNNRCLRAFLDQSYNLNDSNKTAIYHGMLKPKCEPYMAKLLHLPFVNRAVVKPVEKTKATFVKAKISKPKKSEEMFTKDEKTKTINAINMMEYKKRKTTKQTKLKTIGESVSENFFLNKTKIPIDRIKTTSDLEDMSVATYIDGCMIENCGENTFKGDLVKKIDDVDAELKQMKQDVKLPQKYFPEYLKTLTSFHLNPMFVNETGKARVRCYPTFWCFPELDGNDEKSDDIESNDNTSNSNITHSDPELSNNNGPLSVNSTEHTSAQTNIVCVRSDSIKLDAQNEEGSSSRVKVATSEESGICEETDQWHEIELDAAPAERDVLFFNEGMNDSVLTFLKGSVGLESTKGKSERECVELNNEMNLEEEIGDTNVKINLDVTEKFDNFVNNVTTPETKEILNEVDANDGRKMENAKDDNAINETGDVTNALKIVNPNENNTRDDVQQGDDDIKENINKSKQDISKQKIQNPNESVSENATNNEEENLILFNNEGLDDIKNKFDQNVSKEEIQNPNESISENAAKNEENPILFNSEELNEIPFKNKSKQTNYLKIIDGYFKEMRNRAKSDTHWICATDNLDDLDPKQEENPTTENSDIKNEPTKTQACIQTEWNEEKIKILSMETFSYDADKTTEKYEETPLLTTNEALSVETDEKASPVETNEETPQIKTTEETQSIKTVQETPSIKTIEKTESIKTVQETPSIKTIEKTELIKTVQETPTIKTIEEIQSVKTRQETSPIKTTLETPIETIEETTQEAPSVKTIKETPSMETKNEKPPESLIKNEILNEQSDAFLTKVRRTIPDASTSSTSEAKTNEDRIVNLKLYMAHRANSPDYKPHCREIMKDSKPPITAVNVNVPKKKTDKPTKKEFRRQRVLKKEERTKLKLSDKDEDLKFEEYEGVVKIDEMIKNAEKKRGKSVLFSEKDVVLEDKETNYSISGEDDSSSTNAFPLDDVFMAEDAETIYESLEKTIVKVERKYQDVETFTHLEIEERSVQVSSSIQEVASQIIKSENEQPESEKIDDDIYNIEDLEDEDFGEETYDESMENIPIIVEERVFDENEQRLLEVYEGQLIGGEYEETSDEPKMYGDGDVPFVENDEESMFSGYEETSFEEYDTPSSDPQDSISVEAIQIGEGTSQNEEIQLEDIPEENYISGEVTKQNEEIEPKLLEDIPENYTSGEVTSQNVIQTNITELLEDIPEESYTSDEVTSQSEEIQPNRTELLEDIPEESYQSDKTSEHNFNSDASEDFEDADVFELQDPQFDVATFEHGVFYDAEMKHYEAPLIETIETKAEDLKEEVAPEFMSGQYDVVENLEIVDESTEQIIEGIATEFIKQAFEVASRREEENDELFLKGEIIPELLCDVPSQSELLDEEEDEASNNEIHKLNTIDEEIDVDKSEAPNIIATIEESNDLQVEDTFAMGEATKSIISSENCEVLKDTKDEKHELKNVKSKKSFPSLSKIGKKAKKESNFHNPNELFMPYLNGGDDNLMYRMTNFNISNVASYLIKNEEQLSHHSSDEFY